MKNLHSLFPCQSCFHFWGRVSILLIFWGIVTPLFAAVQVVEVRWMTDGQDPTFLDLHPLSGRDASSTIFVQADLSGADDMVEDRVHLLLENPILLPDAFPAADSVEVIKGAGGSATVFGELEVRNDINWALHTSGTVLKLKLVTADELGAETVVELGDVFLYGPKGDLPDVELPMMVEATINGGNTIMIPEDLEDDEFEFPATMQLTDVWKGVEEATLSYLHEDGGFFNLVAVEVDVSDLTSGTLTDGGYTTTGVAGKYIKSGTYDLFAFSVEDKAGNELANFGSNAPPGVPQTVEVVNPNEDPAPPVLTSPVVITPTSGDVTTDPLLVTITFSAEDLDTGITFGNVSIFHSTDEDVPGLSYFVTSANLISGDEFSGTYEVMAEIPQGQSAGDYFYQVRLTDGAFQSSTYGKMRPGSTFAPEPLPAGSTEMVTLENTGAPGSPPVMESISVEFDADLAAGPGVMTVTMMISEEGGELSSFGNSVRFISPTGATDISQSFGLFNKDSETGAYVVQINLNKAIETGTYCFAVHLVNSKGYEADYGQNYDFLPFPNNFPGTWEIEHEGPIDYTPPILTEFTVTPGVVESGTDVTLTVTLRIQDEGTGIQFVDGFQNTNFEVLNGLPGLFNSRQPLFFTQIEDPATDARGEGTIFDATYTIEIPLTAGTFGGDFLSFRLNVMDCAGNTRTFDSSICNVSGNHPFPFHYAQVTTNGNEDPIIWSNGGGDSASVLVEENITEVTTVRAFDSPGDILTFAITGGADSALFDLGSTSGELTFKTAPSFAAPTDAGADGVYDVTVQVTDGLGGEASQDIAVTVIEKPGNGPPMITSNGGGDSAAILVEENETAVTVVTATDPDLPGDTLTFSINGGADAALFDIVASTGVLTFKAAPVVATPTDANTDSVYEVTVEVSDAGDPVGMDSQDISVTVIEHIVDEQDYEDFANSTGTFPPSATADDKKADTDFDGDGMTNEEEFAAGTDPADPYDFFWSVVGFDPVDGTKVVFCPYLPDSNDYNLLSVFGGSNNNEATSLNYTAQPFEDDPTMGCFVVPPSSGGALEALFLMVNTLKHSL